MGGAFMTPVILAVSLYFYVQTTKAV